MSSRNRHLPAQLAVLVLALSLAGWAGQASVPSAHGTKQVRARGAQPATGTNAGEQKAEAYLDSVRQQPSLLLEFLREMPKGADLHNHLSGAVYAESYLNWAAQDGLCLDRRTLAAMPAESLAGEESGGPPVRGCDPSKGRVPARNALGNPELYREVLAAWSMRGFLGTTETGHDHFFNTFGKFGAANENHLGDMLAEVVSRAGHQHVLYLELILNPDSMQAARLGAGMGWSGDMAGQRQKIIDKQVERVVATARLGLDEGERRMRELLKCGTLNEDPGCHVVVRYIYEVHRGLPRDQVFSEMVAGFEMATADPRVVAVNLVMPEDDYVELHDFSLHMDMLDYLHRIYPKVRLTLHAGELAPGLVPPEDLRFHIRASLERGHAERIGHGVDVMHETDPLALLREMADRGVLVEICLTSNDVILGVRGAQHPLPIYLRYGVPVALATDDEGVSRSDLTQEYLRAVRDYSLTYAQLKRMARDSVQYGFLAGESLWTDARQFRRVEACRADSLEAGSGLGDNPPGVSAACRQFLSASPRAQVQWRLEQEFGRFESQVCCRAAAVAAGRP